MELNKETIKQILTIIGSDDELKKMLFEIIDDEKFIREMLLTIDSSVDLTDIFCNLMDNYRSGIGLYGSTLHEKILGYMS